MDPQHTPGLSKEKVFDADKLGHDLTALVDVQD